MPSQLVDPNLPQPPVDATYERQKYLWTPCPEEPKLLWTIQNKHSSSETYFTPVTPQRSIFTMNLWENITEISGPDSSIIKKDNHDSDDILYFEVY